MRAAALANPTRAVSCAPPSASRTPQRPRRLPEVAALARPPCCIPWIRSRRLQPATGRAAAPAPARATAAPPDPRPSSEAGSSSSSEGSEKSSLGSPAAATFDPLHLDDLGGGSQEAPATAQVSSTASAGSTDLEELPPPPPAPQLPHGSPIEVLQYHLEGNAVDWHVALPETTYYILGTAHVSRHSCEDVAALIRAVQPEVVLVELCPERQAMLADDFEVHAPTSAELTEMVRSGKVNPFAAAYAWLLPRVGGRLDAKPGEEFRVAAREARAVGAKLVLGDRPIKLTMARVWAALSAWEKVRLVTSLLWMGWRMPAGQEIQREVERLKDADALTLAVGQFAQDFPHIMKPLVEERDQYLTYMLRRLAGRANVVVAVVGAGHLPGIRRWWCEEIDFKQLSSPPPK